MAKRIAAILLVAVTLFAIMPCAYAYDAQEHDSYLEQVLFGDAEYKASQTGAKKEKIQMLEYASYLAIDQYRSDGQTELDYLKSHKVKSLPPLAQFDLTGIFYGSHRNYTHRGWNYQYIVPKGEKYDKANWTVRKDILRSTANKIFDFGFFNELFGKYCTKNESFCALVYYVHILGDQLEAENYKVNDLTLACARMDADDKNPDIFSEIKAHSQILFADQKDSTTYKSFMQELDTLAENTRALVGTQGGINTDEKFIEYHAYEEDLMDLLISYIPLLLEKEAFFKDVFYS